MESFDPLWIPRETNVIVNAQFQLLTSGKVFHGHVICFSDKFFIINSAVIVFHRQKRINTIKSSIFFLFQIMSYSFKRYNYFNSLSSNFLKFDRLDKFNYCSIITKHRKIGWGEDRIGEGSIGGGGVLHKIGSSRYI